MLTSFGLPSRTEATDNQQNVCALLAKGISMGNFSFVFFMQGLYRGLASNADGADWSRFLETDFGNWEKNVAWPSSCAGSGSRSGSRGSGSPWADVRGEEIAPLPLEKVTLSRQSDPNPHPNPEGIRRPPTPRRAPALHYPHKGAESMTSH